MTEPSRRVVVAALAAVLGLGLSACHETGVAAPAPKANEALPWTLHERRTYALELSSSYGVANSPVFELAVSGSMEVTPMRGDATSMEFLLTIIEPKLSARQSGQVLPGIERIAADLKKPYLFTLADGRFSNSRAASDTNALALGILRTLSGALQQATSSDGKSRWQATENDATGQYVVDYERVEPGVLRKRKLRYESWNAATQTRLAMPGGNALPLVKSSMIEWHGEGGAPERIVLREQLETVLGATTALQSATSLELKRGASRPNPLSDSATSELYARTVERPLNEAGAIVPAADMDRAKMGDLSFAQIVAGLEAQAGRRGEAKAKSQEPGQNYGALVEQELSESPTFMAEETRLFTALNASLRQQPENLKQVEQLIRSGSGARDMLISGLGGAGTAEGHRLLLELMADKKLPEDVRNGCGVSLIRTQKPSAVAVAGVEARLGDPDWHRLAVYGLATYARLLRQAGNDAEGKRLVELLVSRIRTAERAADKADLLMGLSNSAAPEIFELAREFAISPVKDLREAAVTAVRLLETPAAEEVILERLASDPAPSVRLAALRALKNKRTPSEQTARTVELTALGDSSERIRQDAVRLIATWARQVPALRSTLERVSRTDPNETIRTLAARVLSAQQTDSGYANASSPTGTM